MNKKILSAVVSAVLSIAFVFSAVPVLASMPALPISDGIDLEIANPNRVVEDDAPPIRSRLFNWQAHYYYSPSFTSGVWIGNQREFTNSKGIWLIRPYQSNIEQPWSSISINYQAWDARTNTVRSSAARHGSHQHSSFSLNVDNLGTYKIYLVNISRVPATVDGAVEW